MLSSGISALSRESAVYLSHDDVYDDLEYSITGISVSYEVFISNIANLQRALGISNIEFANAINFDSSYISRILSGERRPADIPSFLDAVARFVSGSFTKPENLSAVKFLTDCTDKDLSDQNGYYLMLRDWLGNSTGTYVSPMDSFLTKLNEFDLEKFSRESGYDDLSIPRAVYQRRNSRYYYGISEFKQSEIDFMKATVLSKSTEPVFSYSEMPIEEMGEDTDFLNKFLIGMATMLKRGLHINTIHEVNRPIGEMLLGLENWIPMYMTGQISPFYLPGPTDRNFLRLLKTSGAAALTGEAVPGHHSEGRYYLTKNKEEVEYYNKLSARLLDNAKPLMKIFVAGEEENLYETLRSEFSAIGAQGNFDAKKAGLHPAVLQLATDNGIRAVPIVREGLDYLSITMIRDRFVLISKEKNPNIHFLIKHPKMIRAFADFSI